MRRAIDLTTTITQFQRLARCVEEAPRATYVDAKNLRTLIGDAFDAFNASLREAGLAVDNTDKAFELEAHMYEYVKRCNPEAYFLMTAEGFGHHIDGPARERILQNLRESRETVMRSRMVCAHPAGCAMPPAEGDVFCADCRSALNREPNEPSTAGES